jgi:hypothetical protein
MKKKSSFFIVIVVVIILLVIITLAISQSNANKNTKITEGPTFPEVTADVDIDSNISVSCIKSNNCCEVASDCEYIWFTGGCYVPEYVTRVQKEAQEKGMHIGEAREREGVTCSCENNKCITHG